jgi:hypothetical protein
MSAADRRQTPRLHVGDRVRIEMAPHGVALSVLDFSVGGFRAECAAPFGPETDLRNPKTEARIHEIVDHLTAVLQVA